MREDTLTQVKNYFSTFPRMNIKVELISAMSISLKISAHIYELWDFRDESLGNCPKQGFPLSHSLFLSVQVSVLIAQKCLTCFGCLIDKRDITLSAFEMKLK